MTLAKRLIARFAILVLLSTFAATTFANDDRLSTQDVALSLSSELLSAQLDMWSKLLDAGALMLKDKSNSSEVPSCISEAMARFDEITTIKDAMPLIRDDEISKLTDRELASSIVMRKEFLNRYSALSIRFEKCLKANIAM